MTALMKYLALLGFAGAISLAATTLICALRFGLSLR